MKSRLIPMSVVALGSPDRQWMRRAMTRLSTAVALIAVLACSPMSAEGRCRAGLEPDRGVHDQCRTESVRPGALHGDHPTGSLRSGQRDHWGLRALYRRRLSRRRAHPPTPPQPPRRTGCSRPTSRRRDSRHRLCGVAGGDPGRRRQDRRHRDRRGCGCTNDRPARRRWFIAPRSSTCPESSDPGVWQTTPSCSPAGGILFHWHNVTPFGIPNVAGSPTWMERFLPGPPPALTSTRYAKDYNEVMTVGSLNSTERPQDRADVVRLFAVSSPSFVFNLVARQLRSHKASRCRRTRGPWPS